MQEDVFLLHKGDAKYIYERFLKGIPIVDYHCHLKPEEIYENKKFKNLTELWLEKDHYKFRLMRANGIDERRITGDASDYDKFLAWVETLEGCIGNPLHHWSHMELSQFFGVNEWITRENAPRIWEKVNAKLGEQGLGARDFITRSNVKVIGTTDQPLSLLEHHQQLKEMNLPFEVVPTFRLDAALILDDARYFAQIKTQFGVEINTLNEYLDFLKTRIMYFNELGCRAADFGVGYLAYTTDLSNPTDIFLALRAGQVVTKEQLDGLKRHILLEIISEIKKQDWVFQLHFGAVGSVNEKAKGRLGAGTGFDTIMDQSEVAMSLLNLFNQLNNRGILPKTVLYNIDGTKNNVTQSIMACFQDNEEGIKGKIQHGPAWWFQDTLRGNKRQIQDLAEQGIIMNFIGMTTDSRSFLSYARHDYFRRILATCIDEWIESGEMPKDETFIQRFTQAIAYKNAHIYFGFKKSL